MKSQTKLVKSQRLRSTKHVEDNRCGDDVKVQDKNDTLNNFRKLWRKLKNEYGSIYICNNCGNIVDFDGWCLRDNNHMGNNYSYVEIYGKVYHYSICDDCKKAVLLGSC
jgi:uncharacterized protein YlaI